MSAKGIEIGSRMITQYPETGKGGSKKSMYVGLEQGQKGIEKTMEYSVLKKSTRCKGGNSRVLPPQRRFGGQPPHKQRLLGRRLSTDGNGF